MADLLPHNATDQERALSESVERAARVAAPIKHLWNPQTCPLAVLPWLAWSLSVDEWNPDWTEAQKRAAIANAIEIHRQKGTIGALKKALESLGYETEIDEDTGAAYTFRLLIDASNGITESVYQEAEAIAERTKNVRSHLAQVAGFSKSAGAVAILSATISGEETQVSPEEIPAVNFLQLHYSATIPHIEPEFILSLPTT
jgi:phage tail P2-like protein